MNMNSRHHRRTNPLSSNVIIVTVILMIGLVCLYSFKDKELAAAPYNPLSYKHKSNELAGSQPNMALSEAQQDLLKDDEALVRVINNEPHRSNVTIYTFFNEDKISQSSQDDQRFQKTLLRYWINWYQHMGFKIKILSYDDATKNLKFEKFKNRGLLMNEKNQVIEKNLKLLAWEERLEENGIYIDYNLFLNLNEKQDKKLLKFKNYDNFITYDDSFEILSTDKSHLSQLISMYLTKPEATNDIIYKDDSIPRTWFLNYSFKAMSLLINTDTPKFLHNNIPKIINHQLRYIKLSSIKGFNLIDMITLSDHYFIKPFIQTIKAFKTTPLSNDPFLSKVPIPTYDNLIKFQNFKAQHEGDFHKFPDKITIDDSFQTIKISNEFLVKLYRDLFPAYRINIPPIRITDELPLNDFQQFKTNNGIINIVAWPHPLNVLSALDHSTMKILNADDLPMLENRNYICSTLLNLGLNLDILKKFILERGLNTFFYISELDQHNSEKDAMKSLNQQLSVDFGIYALDLQISQEAESDSSNKLGIQRSNINDESKLIYEKMEVIPGLTHNQMTTKLNNINDNFFKFKEMNQRPFKINSGRSLEELDKLKAKLKVSFSKENKDKGLNDIIDLDKVLQVGDIESKRDPIIEIAENYNALDAEIWYFVKNLKFIQQRIYQLLSTL